MTVRLSPHKVAGILSDYFRGVSQQGIARRRGVDQSTVSIYASRFKRLAGQIGILQAGKEFGVYKEVDSLRSLSVELTQGKLTVEDALAGVRIIKQFLALRVPTDRHTQLITLCQKIAEPAFIEASLELIKVEREAGMSYEEMVRQCLALSREVVSKKKELEGRQADLNSISRVLVNKKKEASELEAELSGIRRNCEAEHKAVESRLTKIREESKIREEELTEFRSLKAQLGKSGMTVPALIKLAKEFSHGQTNS